MTLFHYDVFDEPRDATVKWVAIRRTVKDVTIGGTIMSLGEAKSELAITDTGDGSLDTDTDARVTAKLGLVRQWCEDQSYKTYTSTATTRTLELDKWTSVEIQIDAPPLIGVTSVEYYDETDSLQTLSGTMYEVLTPTRGRGRIVWNELMDRPALKGRADAVKVTYTCGYAAAADIPLTVVEAAKLMLSFFWDNDREDVVLRTYERSAIALMRGEEWGGYA